MDEPYHFYRKSELYYCIDLKIDSLDQFFNSFDPADHGKRSLNHNLVREIIQHFIIFPKKQPVQIVFHIPKKLAKNQGDMEMAYRKYFKLKHLDSHLHMRRRFSKAKHILLAAVVIFIGLMSCSFLLQNYAPDYWIWHLLSEGLFIGSWVSMWYPIELMLYDWIPLNEERNNFRKLSLIKVSFVQSDK